MERVQYLIALMAGLLLSTCAPDADDTVPQDRLQTPSPATSAHTQQGTLGPVRYAYDPAELIRADISLALPPTFDEEVFAVKFIPADLLGNVGDAPCSYESDTSSDVCTAEDEIGFAMAFLERPIDTYGDAMSGERPGDMVVAQAEIDGHAGFTVTTADGTTRLRYTFVSVDQRTFLTVERQQARVREGATALARLRESLVFPEG